MSNLIDFKFFSPRNIVNLFSKNVRVGKADLHIHSDYSDGKPSIEKILEYVQYKTDLDVIAITDHDTIDGSVKAHEIAKKMNYRFEVIIGEEISCIEGHLLGLFMNKSIPPGLTLQDALQELKQQDAISISSHPFYRTRLKGHNMHVMNGLGPQELISRHHHIDGIETVNSTPTLADENLAATVLNRAILFRAETGSSDAHILEAIGKGFTVFEGKTSSDLRHAIKHQQTQAIYAGWTFLAVLKYAWFFIPKGIRLLWSNITSFHNRG